MSKRVDYLQRLKDRGFDLSEQVETVVPRGRWLDAFNVKCSECGWRTVGNGRLTSHAKGCSRDSFQCWGVGCQTWLPVTADPHPIRFCETCFAKPENKARQATLDRQWAKHEAREVELAAARAAGFKV